MGLATSAKILGSLTKGRTELIQYLTSKFCKDKGLKENLLKGAGNVIAVPFKLVFDSFSSATPRYKLGKIVIGSYAGLKSLGYGLSDYSDCFGIRQRTKKVEGSFTYSLVSGTIKTALITAPIAATFICPTTALAGLVMGMPGLLMIPIATALAMNTYEQHVLTGKTSIDFLARNGWKSSLEDDNNLRNGGWLFQKARELDTKVFGIKVLKMPSTRTNWEVQA